MGSCVAVTYVPDKAPVRQKMLFASTRLTLVRELGMSTYAATSYTTFPLYVLCHPTWFIALSHH